MKRITILILLFFYSYINAQRESLSNFNFITEQDFSPPLISDKLNEDRNYTMGVLFSYSSNSEKFPLIWARKKISQILIPNIDIGNTKDINDDLNYSTENPTIISKNIFSISGTAFTPDNLRESGIITNDRPYAFLLSFGVSQNYLTKNNKNNNEILRSMSLNVGMFGTNIGKTAQTEIHKLMNDNNTKDPYNPEGWHNQINNKQYLPVFMYKYKKDELFYSKQNFVELFYSKEYYLGYYTGISYGIGGRIGLIDHFNWSRSNNIDTGNKIFSLPKSNRPQSELYLSLFLRGNILPYNYSLSGGIFAKSVYTLKMFSEANPFIADGFIGLGGSFYINKKKTSYWNIELKPLVFKSPEMWGNNKISRTHYWGLFSINIITFKELLD